VLHPSAAARDSPGKRRIIGQPFYGRGSSETAEPPRALSEPTATVQKHCAGPGIRSGQDEAIVVETSRCRRSPPIRPALRRIQTPAARASGRGSAATSLRHTVLDSASAHCLTHLTGASYWSPISLQNHKTHDRYAARRRDRSVIAQSQHGEARAQDKSPQLKTCSRCAADTSAR
jgi:hypothetical protein